jgi:ABC transport permease subunit
MIFRIKQIPEILHQIYFIGARSATIVMLVGLFTGMVMGLQLYYVLIKFGSAGALGTAVSLSLIRELGPVLTAIMITARAGSAMTAEIGIQRISEQIDALQTMRVDPLGYLVSPRIAAGLISFPILTAFFDLVGIMGGWFSGCLLLGVNSGSYFYRVVSSTVRRHPRRVHQSARVFDSGHYHLLLSGLLHSYALRRPRRQGRESVHHFGGRALVCDDSCRRLRRDLVYPLGTTR